MEKNKKNMKEKPISNILFTLKSEEEWEYFSKEVKQSNGGFDL